MIEYGFFFLRHLNVLVDFATPEEKFQFLGSTFPEKFHFKDGKVRTNSDNLIVQALFTPDAAFTKIKNGSETMFSLPSGGVEFAGFEPNKTDGIKMQKALKSLNLKAFLLTR